MELTTEPRQQINRRTDKTTRYGWARIGNTGIFRLIHKAKLEVDRASESEVGYQRDAVPSKVLNIRRNWNWPACGTLIVARRPDGSFYVVEGQQRKLAADGRDDISELPCLVFEMPEVEEEAKAFLETNQNRKPLTIIDVFPALLRTNDEAALFVQGLIKASGRRLSKTSAPGTIKCVSTLLNLARQNREALSNTWPLIVALTEDESIEKMLVDGLCYLHGKLMYGETITEGKWQQKVFIVGRKSLLDGAKAAAGYEGRSHAKIWAMGMLKVINKGLMNRLSLDPKYLADITRSS